MDDVHFSLPNPMAEPGSPEANPRISAKVEVIANLPEEMNFPVSVPRIRANADVYFENQKLGVRVMPAAQIPCRRPDRPSPVLGP